MPRQKKHRRAIVIPDQHFPIHDQAAVNVVLKAIELVKPNIFKKRLSLVETTKDTYLMYVHRSFI